MHVIELLLFVASFGYSVGNDNQLKENQDEKKLFVAVKSCPEGEKVRHCSCFPAAWCNGDKISSDGSECHAFSIDEEDVSVILSCYKADKADVVTGTGNVSCERGVIACSIYHPDLLKQMTERKVYKRVMGYGCEAVHCQDCDVTAICV